MPGPMDISTTLRASPRRFQVPTFRIPAFTLQPLNPQMGVDVPSSAGLFPWTPSQFPASAMSTWGPAENLTNPVALAVQRQAQQQAARRNAILTWLSSLRDPSTGSLLLKRQDIDALAEEEKGAVKEVLPEVWTWYLGGVPE